MREARDKSQESGIALPCHLDVGELLRINNQKNRAEMFRFFYCCLINNNSIVYQTTILYFYKKHYYAFADNPSGNIGFPKI